ncbi:MAG: hypothetical protein GXX81_10255 [Acidobacteria bacterium]|nr:hypothetical protein [Acidobacteriota bacterium]
MKGDQVWSQKVMGAGFCGRIVAGPIEVQPPILQHMAYGPASEEVQALPYAAFLRLIKKLIKARTRPIQYLMTGLRLPEATLVSAVGRPVPEQK